MPDFLQKASPALAAVLALTFCLAPIKPALAGEPEASTSGFAEPPPELEPAPLEDPQSEPLRIVAEDPITVAEPPAPVIEPAPAPTIASVDSRRPRPGTGLIALGALSMGASAALVITALAGPGWADLSRRDAAILGGLSLPSGMAGAALVGVGVKANRRYANWADRNSLTPPATGNGILISGAAVTIAGLGATAVATQRAITDSSPSRADWALVGVSGVIAAVGLVVLCNGMLTRSKFAAWERAAYLQPGTMALRGGAGLSLSGKF